MSICELCWAPFENDEELAKHVEMEEAVDWPVGGLTPDDDDQDSTYAETKQVAPVEPLAHGDGVGGAGRVAVSRQEGGKGDALTIELDVLESCRRGGRWHGGDSSVSVADKSSLSRGWFGSEPSACAISAPDAMDAALSGGRP